ncbi:TPA: hypothetical protein I8W37_002749 [Corynebacterium striatum]|nr:hypothetical protein [Corynebacterium striatum]HAT1164215.1 hypothetical protein [Corynebacterium striatum]HAT1166787.1 hypothetical protein [Corynebacterium striatum]HAT1169658.1 hypothetical protein [Corynebacterium striatum]HAT1174864.1 hypothetical protein [Corynebacterium striatum]
MGYSRPERRGLYAEENLDNTNPRPAHDCRRHRRGNPTIEIYAVEGATLNELQARAYSPVDVELAIKALAEVKDCAEAHYDELADAESWHEDNII